MSDYISRQVALDALGVTKNATKYGGDHSGYDTMMLYEIHDALTGIPAADVVPVVRCEYCKHHIVSRQGRLYCIRGFEQTLFSAFSAVDNPIFEREPDSFCSYGERKE